MSPCFSSLAPKNNGVKLTINGSEVLDDLKVYEKDGRKILVGGTCLNHFNLLEKKRVGEQVELIIRAIHVLPVKD